MTFVQLYDVSLQIVNLMSYSFFALYLPMNFPWVYVVERYGLRSGVVTGIVATAIGLWARCLVNVSFTAVLIGQMILAAFQPVLYNTPAKVTSNWFPKKERPMATMVGAQMNLLGIFVGFLLPRLFIDAYSGDTSELTSEKERVYNK